MDANDLDLRVRTAVYQHFAEQARRPTPADVAKRAGVDEARVREAYPRLRALRVLALEPDGTAIRMAPPFSGVPTQHVAEVEGRRYYANCAWDVLGVIAALHKAGVAHSRCEQTLEPLRLAVGLSGPESCDWLFHCLVPAAHWWDDIVFT